MSRSELVNARPVLIVIRKVSGLVVWCLLEHVFVFADGGVGGFVALVGRSVSV